MGKQHIITVTVKVRVNDFDLQPMWTYAKNAEIGLKHNAYGFLGIESATAEVTSDIEIGSRLEGQSPMVPGRPM